MRALIQQHALELLGEALGLAAPAHRVTKLECAVKTQKEQVEVRSIMSLHNNLHFSVPLCLSILKIDGYEVKLFERSTYSFSF